MPTRFVPVEEFTKDLETHKATILKFIKDHYKANGIGPTQEQIRDGLEMENDLVSHVLIVMAKEGTDIKKIQA